MYKNTTGVQVARAVAAWVLGAGVALFPLVARSIFAGRPTTAAWVVLAIIATGASVIVGARWRLTQIDRLNRDFLLGPLGVSVLVPRAKFLQRATLAKRWCLVLIMVLGTLFIVLVSAVNCVPDQGGFCGAVSRPSDAQLTSLQLTTIGLGLVYIALVVLTRTHESETDRLDKVIAHGQHMRRNGGPMAGSSRSGWE